MRNRVGAGVPAGGQFAATPRSEPTIALTPETRQGGSYSTVERHIWLDQSQLVEVNDATGLTDDEFDAISDHYLAAALYASMDDDADGQSYPLDERFAVKDFDAADRAVLEHELAGFIAEHRDLVHQALATKSYGAAEESGAHGAFAFDLWLTRNHHGSGFWDREDIPGALARQLTDAAHELGETTIYVGDDIRLHCGG